jgi:hypothetical protein
MSSEKFERYVCEANPGALHHLDLPQLIFAVPHSEAVECACVGGCQQETSFDDRRKNLARPIQWIVPPTMK